MKNNVIFLSIALIFLGLTAEAQRSIRIGYVDMNYILENVPEYQEAQAQLDKRLILEPRGRPLGAFWPSR